MSALDAASVAFDPGTSVLTLESDPNEMVLVEAAIKAKRETGSAPHAFVLGSAWKEFFDGIDMPAWARESPAFLCGPVGKVPMAFDSTLPPRRILVLPKIVGKKMVPAQTADGRPTPQAPYVAMEDLVGKAADKMESLADSLNEAQAGLVPMEDATWPPRVVNGSGRVTVGANTLGLAVSLSIMQVDMGMPGRSQGSKQVSQNAGFDPGTARHIAAQLVAAAEWVEAKQRSV